MILPTKHVTEAECLLVAGALVLRELRQPRTVTEVWESIREEESVGTFGRLVLALDMLYIIGVVDFEDGLLTRKEK